MVRVLQVAESGTGGVPAFIDRICEGLSGDLTFGIACPPDSELAARAPAHATIFPIAMAHAINPISDYRAAGQIRSLVERERYDIVHLNSTKAGIIGVPLKRGLKAKTVFTPHALRSHAYAEGSLKRRIALFVEKRVCSAADVIAACSGAEAEGIVQAGLAPRAKVRVVENGVDVGQLQTPSTLSRGELGIPEDAFVVGTVGRISAQKDPATFLAAAARILDGAPGAHFVMAGDGPLLSEVGETVRQLGLTDRFHLLGWRDDAQEVLKLFDVFLITSRYEGGSFAILEAAGAGRPIVACDSPGVGSLIDDGETGLLSPAGDAAGVAVAVLSLYKDAKIGQRLAARAFETIAYPRRLEVMVEEWGALYRSVSEGEAAARAVLPAQRNPA